MKKINRIECEAPLEPRKRTAAYARVSADSDDGQHSFEAQVSYYTRLISSNPLWEFAGVYADEGVSGTRSALRKGFTSLMEDCEAGKIDLILTKSVSRFARNTVDLLAACRRLRVIGVEVRFEREQISTFTAEGELLLSITASIAQEESRSISDNVKWGIRRGFQRGHHNAFALYGYRQRDGVITIVPEEAEVVRLIYDSYLAGNSVGHIERLLDGMGVRSYRGGHFSQCAIRDILRQEKYTGNMLLQKYYIRDHISHKKCRNNGELPQYYVENTHPAIIDAETFRRAQREILRRREHGRRGNKNNISGGKDNETER